MHFQGATKAGQWEHLSANSLFMGAHSYRYVHQNKGYAPLNWSVKSKVLWQLCNSNTEMFTFKFSIIQQLSYPPTFPLGILVIFSSHAYDFFAMMFQMFIMLGVKYVQLLHKSVRTKGNNQQFSVIIDDGEVRNKGK